MEKKKCSEGKNCFFFLMSKKLFSLSLIQQYVFITIRLIIHARNQKEAFDRKKNQHISSRIRRAVTFMSNFFSDKSKCQHFFSRQNMVEANVNSQKKHVLKTNVSVQKSSTHEPLETPVTLGGFRVVSPTPKMIMIKLSCVNP